MPTPLHRFLESLESRTLLHAGDIDPAFNSGRLLTTAFPGFTASASVVDPLPDGSFLVGGTVNRHQQAAGIGIAKYNFDGSLDTTFGNNGEISGIPHGLATLSQIINTPDGGFLAVGSPYLAGGEPIIVKFTAAGAIDTAFAENGTLVLLPYDFTEASAAVDSHGRILVAGLQIDDRSAILDRFLPDGQLDTSFNGDGAYTEDPTPAKHSNEFYSRIFSNVAITPAGNIVVTGEEYLNQIDPNNPEDTDGQIISYTTIVREVTASGKPAKQFDSNIDADSFKAFSFENVVGVAPNGNIVLSGAQLMELKSDGTLNTLFGVSGTAGISPNYYGPAAVAVAQDGSIIVALPASDNAGINHEFALRRIRPNGTLDKNFGTNGILRLATSTDLGGLEFTIAVAMAPDGTVIAASQAGGVSPSGKVDTRQFEVARVFTGNGPAVQLIPTATKSSPSSVNVNVLIRDTDGIDTSTLDSNNLRFVDSQNDFFKMQFISSTPLDGNDYIQATYNISAPAIALPGYPPEGWTVLQGTYQIRLAGSQITDLLGNPAEAQILGTIAVNIPPAA